MLSDEQLARYERDGFLAIPDFADRDAIAALRRRAVEIVDEWEPTAERTVFSTEQQERVSNREFLASGDITWCFFEEEAFGPNGELTQPKELSINKLDDGTPGYRIENPFGQTIQVMPRPPAFRATVVFEWEGATPDDVAELVIRAEAAGIMPGR